MWLGLFPLLILWTPALGWIATSSWRDGTLLQSKNDDSAYSFTHEGFTPQKMVTGCQGVRYDNELHTDFYIIDATGSKKYIYPGQSVKVAFPAPGLFPGFFRQNTVFFHEMCFPKQCGVSTCGFVVGPVTTTGGGRMPIEGESNRPTAENPSEAPATGERIGLFPSWLKPPQPCGGSSTTTTTTQSPCVPITTPPPLCPPSCAPCQPITITTTTTTTTPSPVPICCCPTPLTTTTTTAPPPQCPPPAPVPQCPPPTTIPPCAAMKGSPDSSVSIPADTKDVTYYASLPGSIRSNTGMIFYPSCEKEAFRQVAIVPFCEHYRSRGRDLKDTLTSMSLETLPSSLLVKSVQEDKDVGSQLNNEGVSLVEKVEKTVIPPSEENEKSV